MLHIFKSATADTSSGIQIFKSAQNCPKRTKTAFLCLFQTNCAQNCPNKEVLLSGRYKFAKDRKKICLNGSLNMRIWLSTTLHNHLNILPSTPGIMFGCTLHFASQFSLKWTAGELVQAPKAILEKVAARVRQNFL
jgi:hypothetical protein